MMSAALFCTFSIKPGELFEVLPLLEVVPLRTPPHSEVKPLPPLPVDPSVIPVPECFPVNPLEPAVIPVDPSLVPVPAILPVLPTPEPEFWKLGSPPLPDP